MDRYSSYIGKNNEKYICKLANSIPEVEARLATQEEDFSKKIDLIINYNRKYYFIQVSNQEKSKKQRILLEKRGIYPLSLNKFKDIPKNSSNIISEIENIIRN